MIRAGQLDRRVTLLRLKRVATDWGFDEEWTPAGTVWAERKDQDGIEFLATGVELTKERAMFRIRYRDDVTTGMRLRSYGTDFDIVGMKEIGRRNGWELRCEVTQ